MTDVLQLHDAGRSAAEIAIATGMSVGWVYGELRKHRPDRARKPRNRTSEKRAMVTGLTAQGIAPARVAFLLGVSKAYVYRILSEA